MAAGIAERVGGAAALFKVIVSSFLDFCHFYTFIVYFPSSIAHFLQSLAMLIQSIIVGLNLLSIGSSFFLFFKYLFEENH